MSAYCYQDLVITGKRDELDKFVQKLQSGKKSCSSTPGGDVYELLNTFYPMPDDIFLENEDYLDELPYADDYVKFLDEIAQNYYLAYSKDEDIFYPWSWHGWRLNAWGSQWSDINTRISWLDDTHICITYKTIETPIIQGILHISTFYPQLFFSIAFHNIWEPISEVLIDCGDVIISRGDPIVYRKEIKEIDLKDDDDAIQF